MPKNSLNGTSFIWLVHEVFPGDISPACFFQQQIKAWLFETIK
ncbi:hypothetical protein CSB95_5919 [Pseudomonas aeruginosa]|nr:hypothetical protein CSC29_7061 [Pseudomonas aeruginosa]PRW20037.1 hypothetical protein CSB95_5919 [Pseudomonas aeruginosa]